MSADTITNYSSRTFAEDYGDWKVVYTADGKNVNMKWTGF